MASPRSGSSPRRWPLNMMRRRNSSRPTSATCCRISPTRGSSPMPELDAPLALLAELTHRCPLQCPYCSNPLELERASAEIDTGTWKRVLTEAAQLGVLQVHFSGGEPTVRRDLAELVRHATKVGLYTNLITSGVLLD